MARRIAAKTGTYMKEGQEKGEYSRLGVILSNENGEYMLLDPTVNLAGVLLKQQAHAHKTGGKSGDMVMCSIFDDDSQQQNNQGQQNQGGGYQQQQPQQNNQQRHPNNQQQGNFQQQPNNNGYDDFN